MGRQQRRQRERRQQRPGAPQRQQPSRGSGYSGGRRPPPRGQSAAGNNRPWIIAGIVAVALVAAAVAVAVLINHNSNTSATPTPIPTVSSPGSGAPVDGIKCGTTEALAYHIHQHVALYDNGKAVGLPSSIGIPGGEAAATCFYWIHVHASTPDIVHVESPLKKTFTFGNFIDIWKATTATASPPDSTFPAKLQSAPVGGNVHAFVNGRTWKGSYRSIPLTANAVITVEIGKPVVPPRPFNAWNGL